MLEQSTNLFTLPERSEADSVLSHVLKGPFVPKFPDSLKNNSSFATNNSRINQGSRIQTNVSHRSGSPLEEKLKTKFTA